jgi:hypothetical protein
MFCHFLLWHSLCSMSLFSFCSCNNDVLMCSQFMLFVWDCCVMMIVVIQHSWVTAFWIEFKLWLTHCSKMYSSYNTEIEITIRAHISVTLRLLLRNVFLTALSHFKPSAFSSICSKMVRYLANDFLSVLKLLRYKLLSSLILSHCMCVKADWSASQWLYDLELCSLNTSHNLRCDLT